MLGSKVPLKVGGESERIRCKAELVRVTSQISVGIAPPYTLYLNMDVNNLLKILSVYQVVL